MEWEGGLGRREKEHYSGTSNKIFQIKNTSRTFCSVPNAHCPIHFLTSKGQPHHKGQNGWSKSEVSL